MPTSLSSLWVEEAGVSGGDTAFVAADWTDVSTVGVNPAGATAFSSKTIERGRLRCELAAGVARFAAITFPLPTLADGDDVCFRVLADFQLAAFDAIGSTLKGTVFCGFSEVAGSGAKWVGAGMLVNTSRSSGMSWGRWASTGGVPTLAGAANLGSDSIGNALPGFATRMFDVRARRVGTGVRLYYAWGGGAWVTADSSVAATVIDASVATVHAVVRIATTSATSTSATLVLGAFKHFAGGLPAAIAKG